MNRIWLWVLAPLAQAAQPVSSIVREEHYVVYGQTIEDIQRSISDRTPVRSPQGAFAGNTKTVYQTTYRLVDVSQTACALQNIAVKVESVITLPQLAPGNLSPAVADEWRRYYTALRAHEYLHVESARESARETQQWLASMRISGPCQVARPQVRVAIEAYILKLDERDRQLDVITDHGRSQGAQLDARVR
ncbi:DUF922 domain-containing protein [Pseudomonas akapageensis]|uniref:DUF922 domain-containing protein n=1 Tax=Pseudomonas akapageensis TaxID=2609961 RepID=UPI00140DB1DD